MHQRSAKCNCHKDYLALGWILRQLELVELSGHIMERIKPDLSGLCTADKSDTSYPGERKCTSHRKAIKNFSWLSVFPPRSLLSFEKCRSQNVPKLIMAHPEN